MGKIILNSIEAELNANSEQLAEVIVQRIGLMPRKKGSTEKMHKILIELYERSKKAYREKQPTKALMTVEEMGYFAGITRQTMYDYIKRWIELDLINKISYIDNNNKVIIGYKLNGNTLESAFEKAKSKITNNLETTYKYILELQKQLKNEKISTKMGQKAAKSESSEEEENIGEKEEQ